MDPNRLVAQGYQESTLGRIKSPRGDYAQFDQDARNRYNTWANSPRNNPNFYDVGKVHYKNRFFGQDYNPNDNAQGASAMAWYDWVKSGKMDRNGKWTEHNGSDVISKDPIRDQISALRHYRGGTTQEDATYTGLINDQAAHDVKIHVEVVPTPHPRPSTWH